MILQDRHARIRRTKKKHCGSHSGKTNFAVIVVVVFFAALIVSTGLPFLLGNDGNIAELNPQGEQAGALGPVGRSTEPEKPPEIDWEELPVTIIGDSLTVGAMPEIKKVLVNASVDAEVGRGMGVGFSLLKRRIEIGSLDDVVVIALANNIGQDSISKTEDVIENIGNGRRLIFVTGHGLKNMEALNKFIRGLPDEYPFITVADWDEAITPNTNLLAGDGIHVYNNKANIIYTEIIAKAIEEAFTKPAS
jgi:hypothetical protein